MKATLFGFLFFVALLAGTGCESVKPYQRIYLNDYEMRPGYPGARILEQNVQAYREAASGGGSSKTSGGCGCN